MDVYRTEEEQVEALKQWWKKNGASMLLTVVLALAIGFGWQSWQKRRADYAEAASMHYQQLLVASMQAQQAPSDKADATAGHLAGKLKEDFSDTTYAQYAALLQARMLVQKGDLAGAAEELRWVLEADPDETTVQLVSLRLARVLYAAGDVDGSTAILDGGDFDQFSPVYHELRGDMQADAGDIDGARGHYEQALQGGEGAAVNPLVGMKLHSLPGGDEPVDSLTNREG